MSAYGIPTLYSDVRFRSRLEARWAAFFDHLGWAWEYEPVDLNGYIPDFVLRFHQPLLVEVKPEFLLSELEQHGARIERSGWKHEALIVGANLFEENDWASLGLLSQRDERDESGPSGWGWSDGIFHRCRKCEHPSLYSLELQWDCRVCGYYAARDRIEDIDYEDALSLWRQASNKSQWQRSWGVA